MTFCVCLCARVCVCTHLLAHTGIAGRGSQIVIFTCCSLYTPPVLCIHSLCSNVRFLLLFFHGYYKHMFQENKQEPQLACSQQTFCTPVTIESSKRVGLSKITVELVCVVSISLASICHASSHTHTQT